MTKQQVEPEEEPKQNPEEEVVDLIKRLNTTKDFCDFREKIVKPLLIQWQNKMAQAESLSEVELRATIKHYNTIKSLFYDWFNLEN